MLVGKAKALARGIKSLGLALAFFAVTLPASAGNGLPKDPDQLVGIIRDAIETKDYGAFEELVFWNGAGKIKKRIIRFQLNRGLGRPVKSVEFEDVSAAVMDGVNATGKLSANMEVTNRVRVVYDEAPINDKGKLPTTVYLIGKHEGAYRIALVVRNPDFEDDDGD